MNRQQTRDALLRSHFVPGARWRVASRTHAGLEVEIIRVTRHSITVRPVKTRAPVRRRAWSRQQREDRWTIPLMRFLAAHRPQ